MTYEYTVYENSFGKYAVPDSVGHRPVVKRIKEFDIWEPETIDFVYKNINNLSMVHAGTFFGDMLPAFSKATTGTIYAFEANPESAYCAEKTIELNNLKNIKFTKKGLGETNKVENLTVTMRDKKKGTIIKAGGASSFTTMYLENGITESVEITTIDSVVTEPISILQLDIEGYEINALKGAINTIKKYKPILILETVEEDDLFFIENIIGLGYRYKESFHGNQVWAIEEKQ